MKVVSQERGDVLYKLLFTCGIQRSYYIFTIDTLYMWDSTECLFKHKDCKSHKSTMASLPQVLMDRGVPTFILIQLLLDFETHGGLHGPCSLKALCDLRPQLYGQVDSSRRRAIQNKTHRLKTMTRLAYLELLATHGILPFQPVLQPINTVRGLGYPELPLAPSPTVPTRINAYIN